jgi:flagellar basal body-associated protein FliL
MQPGLFIYIKRPQVMKTIVTLIFVLFIGVAAQAQDAKVDTKVETIEMSIATPTIKENTVARLYKNKNSRVKKALTFTTKRNSAKLA